MFTPKFSFLQATPTYLIAFIILALIIAFYLLGYRLRGRAVLKNPKAQLPDLGALNGTLLGLLGLMLAFTFGMSNSRYDTRRKLVVEEANYIGTAVLRTDIYPDSIRRILRAHFKRYVKARIAHYQSGMNMEKTMENYAKADSIGKEIWTIAASYAKVDNITTRTSELLPALNNMIDITTTRRAAGEATIPDSIMYFLFILCFCSAFLLGYDNKNKIDWIGVMGLAVMLSSTVFTIIDLDRPRSGLIKMDKANQKMVELLRLFEE
jgi:hypothetical protein